MSDLISRQDLRKAMYHEAFEVDSDLQKWDGGCWIRFKLFENVSDRLPSAQITLKDVEEYCKPRCLTVITNDLFEHLKRGVPSAQKTGSWVGIDDEPCEAFECDRCGFVLDDWIQGALYNFCPNCGAYMGGRTE